MRVEVWRNPGEAGREAWGRSRIFPQGGAEAGKDGDALGGFGVGTRWPPLSRSPPGHRRFPGNCSPPGAPPAGGGGAGAGGAAHSRWKLPAPGAAVTGNHGPALICH